MLNYQCDFKCNHSLVDHHVMLEELARQAILTKQHLVGVLFGIKKAYDSLAIWDSLNLYLLESEGQVPTFQAI